MQIWRESIQIVPKKTKKQSKQWKWRSRSLLSGKQKWLSMLKLRGFMKVLESWSFFGSRSIGSYIEVVSDEVDGGESAMLQIHQKLLRTTSQSIDDTDSTFCYMESIPDLEQSYLRFVETYPKYDQDEQIEKLRSDEYPHLSGENARVCLDYSGLGLFSYLQTSQQPSSASIILSETSGHLSNLAFESGCGAKTEKHDLKAQIFDYLNISDDEYGMVFTDSRGGAFKLLADSYPFHKNKNLLTMFDYKSQSGNCMARIAREKGAKVWSACFMWPALNLCSEDLRKTISMRGRGGPDTGLFVFPLQSRVTGTKYSYQWMAHAQENGWHVLLDAESLDPKDMDSLGLSLLRPDFIVASFYRVFGHDPSGFGCLFINKSSRGILMNGDGQNDLGIVRISAVVANNDFSDTTGAEEDGSDGVESSKWPTFFSGLYNVEQVKSIFESRMKQGKRSSGSGEECENEHIGEVISRAPFGVRAPPPPMNFS